MGHQFRWPFFRSNSDPGLVLFYLVKHENTIDATAKGNGGRQETCLAKKNKRQKSRV